MTTSNNTSFPQRFTKIDELTRGDHTYLEVDDECLFLGDYSARKGFSHSATNNLILNFKKPVKYRGTASWPYKARAIVSAAHVFSENLGPDLARITLVPIPPSKLRGDPEYDDRMIVMLRGLSPPRGIKPDVRELIVQNKSMPAAHGSNNRLPPADWEQAYSIDEPLTDPAPSWIGIIDDVLVTGCRFRAVSNVLKSRFPLARITGLFIARRVPEAIDLSEFDF